MRAVEAYILYSPTTRIDIVDGIYVSALELKRPYAASLICQLYSRTKGCVRFEALFASVRYHKAIQRTKGHALLKRQSTNMKARRSTG